jgi:L-amino acid N-acyltransferase YncA
MKIEIRAATEADAGSIVAIYGPFCESTPVSFESAAPLPTEMAGRIRTLSAKLLWLVMTVDSVVRGFVYASPHRDRAAYRWSVDVSAYVDPDFKRKGVGRSLYTSLLDLLRLQGYFKAYAGITIPNPASVKLHEAMGFTLVGVYRGVGFKLGVWHDVAWYQLSLQPERKNPDLPLASPDFIDSLQWNEAIKAGFQHLRLDTA